MSTLRVWAGTSQRDWGEAASKLRRKLGKYGVLTPSEEHVQGVIL